MERNESPKSLKEQIKEQIREIIIGEWDETVDGKCVDALLSLIRADRKAHEEALKVIEQKKKDHTCEFDCVGCLANGFNAARLAILAASEKYQQGI